MENENIDHNERKVALEKQRAADERKNKKRASAKRIAEKAFPPLAAASSIKQVNFAKDWLFMLAGAAAGFKDLLDFIGIGSLPAIGTIVTLCIFILILTTVILAGAPLMSYAILFGGSVTEAFLFGLNFLPFTVGTVVIIYLLTLKKRRMKAEGHTSLLSPKKLIGI